ncbi:S1C family serine protease [Aquabacterium sp. OR-4]|uniref:S1C family serine protease n=1 Tax=Aquabacterium sp. OR-4 TaxID=2978127 RepID=UPI0021B2255C|nr:S1C family serine protease [Aquabacterium sp. OR-4]MDT7836392.1 S1C family serine protease [Aquabacterium sp. OR-4]
MLAILAAVLLAWPGMSPARGLADGNGDSATSLAERSRALERARQAVVGVQATALDDARSIRTLGRERAGSGVVIGSDGLVLTVGYLLIEVESVALQLDDGRTVPARALGYDSASGLGLVQALAPLNIAPAPLGRPTLLALQEPLMVASGGGDATVSTAALLARRAFAGTWEYHLEQALLTAPARRDHSGAGLFNGRGELVGIGSLFLADGRAGADARQDDDTASAPGAAGPANLFVPVDLLPPVLDELRQRGSTRSSQRAWLGLNCVELAGALRVVRVAQDSPADVAGLEVGDRILRIDGTEVSSLAALWQALWSGGAAEREVRLDIQRHGEAQAVRVYSVDRQKTLKRPQGI